MLTYAAVDAYISAFLALVRRPILVANNVVKTAISPSFAGLSGAKSSAVIAPTSKIADRATLMTDTICLILCPEK